MARLLLPTPVPGGAAAPAAVQDLLLRLRPALAGSGPALLPYAAGPPLPATNPGATNPGGTNPEAPDGVPDDVALVVGTSGSTGTPKLAMLTAAALTASADATHERLGGPGRWVLVVPARHIAGLQVLVRSVIAGTEPVVADLAEGFTPAAFVAATPPAGPDRLYTSLVPTQLRRLLADPGARVALGRYQAVLVGGAGSPPSLLAEAREAGVRVVTTYGMSETAGGCVYDGRPLSVTRVRSADDGRLELGGATLAEGYLGRPDLTAAAFRTDPDGSRWFRTDDAGHQDESGRWHVDGRVDDLVNTGGLKVAPRLVEEALLAALPGVAEAVVVGVPDPEWGESVAVVVVLRDAAAPTLGGGEVRDALRGILAPHALPRHVLTVPAIPLRGPGKPDRATLRALVREHLQDGPDRVPH